MTENTVQSDFDHLACLQDGGWDHNRHYHSFILKHMPATCEVALEMRCGTGAFARQMARGQNM